VALALDPNTGCLPSPPVLHEAAPDEVRTTFVEAFPISETRRTIWSTYEAHTAAWKQLLRGEAREQWLDGSFVTSKEDPGTSTSQPSCPCPC